jgi:hypothetical protein
MATLKKNGGGMIPRFLQSETDRLKANAFNKALQDLTFDLQGKANTLKLKDALTAPEKGNLELYTKVLDNLPKKRGGKSRKSKRRKSSKKSRKSVRRR